MLYRNQNRFTIRSKYYRKLLPVKTSADEETRKLIDQEHDWLSKQRNFQNEQSKAQLLISKGRQRLENALKKKSDMLDAQAANGLIGAGDEQVKSVCEELKKVIDELLKFKVN